MDETLIYKKKHSLSSFLCNDIIALFHRLKSEQYPGRCGVGINKKVKDTTDLNLLHINKNIDIIDSEYIAKITQLLSNEIKENMDNYTRLFDEIYPFDTCTLNKKGDKHEYYIDAYQIQMYEQNIGQFVYHEDSQCLPHAHRVITFMWYLNDVDDGGETEFFGHIKIKPTAGTLVLFPATWTYIHKGCVPISSNKYIITGWLYSPH